MINILKEKHQLFEKYLYFQEDLLKVQVKNMQRLVAIIPFQKLNSIDVEHKLTSGEYIISYDNFLVGEKELEHIFEEVLPVLKKHNRKNELKRIEDLYDKHKIQLRDFVKILLGRDENELMNLSRQLKISTQLIRKIAEYITTPYLELCSEYFNKKIKNNMWHRSRCPICGNFPSMGSVNERLQQRILWCRLCATEWKFDDVGCPFCLNNDLKTLKHIFPPDNSPHHIEACDRCRNYIKVINEQLIPDISNFTVDFFATFYLDVIAIEKGYKY